MIENNNINQQQDFFLSFLPGLYSWLFCFGVKFFFTTNYATEVNNSCVKRYLLRCFYPI